MKKISNIEMVTKIATQVSKLGGSTYFVGGYVRDRLLGQKTKDIDIEVHGITPAALSDILDNCANKISIGASFGVFGLAGYDIDIAMPRKEKALEALGGTTLANPTSPSNGSMCRHQNSRGHKDFDIIVDPYCGTLKAARRRDFTVNAIMENVLTGQIVDHFGGQEDLQRGIIRHVDGKSFAEDPLRVLRAAQFAARFDFTIADETIQLCKTMDLSKLPKERIMGELEKALLKSDHPSIFFEPLREMDQLDLWFPELQALIGVAQPVKHHAEGDAWTHTMMVLDAAAPLKKYAANPLGLMLTAITHDFGKAICTQFVKGAIHAYNHETLGLPLVEAFIRRLTNEKALIKYVLNLSELHMKPGAFAAANSSVKSTNKMFDASVDPLGLLAISIADGLGKLPQIPAAANQGFFQERLEIYREYMARPYVQGRDLIEAGLEPGAQFTEYLKFAHKLRLAGVDKNAALKQILAMDKKYNKGLKST